MSATEYAVDSLEGLAINEAVICYVEAVDDGFHRESLTELFRTYNFAFDRWVEADGKSNPWKKLDAYLYCVQAQGALDEYLSYLAPRPWAVARSLPVDDSGEDLTMTLRWVAATFFTGAVR